MDQTLFYVFGIGLVVSALGVAAIGLRFERFPSTGAALAGVIAYFAAMVAATTTFAVLNARDEQHKRQAEGIHAPTTLAQETTAPSATTTTTSTTGGAPSGAAPQGKATTLKLAAESNAIAYDTKQLSGKAGSVTIDFTNPSAVTHDVCIEDPSGQQVGCSNTIAQGSTSLSENLTSGRYTFFCSVDSHRLAGMEGTLTIK
jgi:plastocyanin